MHQEQAGKGKFGILRSQFATQKPVQGSARKEGNCRDQSNRNNQADNHKGHRLPLAQIAPQRQFHHSETPVASIRGWRIAGR